MFDSIALARTTLERLAADFVATELSPDDALRVVDELGAVRRLVDGMVAKAAKRVADTDAHVWRGERSGAVLVARTLGVNPGEVRTAVETAKLLEQLPATDAAVRAGKLSAPQARMIAEAASFDRDAEHHLLQVAEEGLVSLKDACILTRARVEEPAARRARQHGQRTFRMWTDADGMLAGSFRLAPEVGGRVKAVIDREVQRIYRSKRRKRVREGPEAYAADAFAKFVLGDDGTVVRGANATVHVLIDHGALVRGATVDGEVCEIPGVGPVDVGWVRELLGSAFLTAIVKRGKDILTVARIGRHIPEEIRTALMASGRECDVEGCHHRGYLEIDHIHEHARGGPTSLANLCWLCWQHHRMKTSGWQLGPLDPERRKRTLRPPPAARVA